MASWMQLLSPEMRKAFMSLNQNAPEAQVEDAASGIYGNVINSGDHSHSSPVEQMDVEGESPMEVPQENAAETEAAREDGQNVSENEPVDEGEPHTIELPEGYYEVEAIRAKRVRKGQKQYLIKWLGWPEETNTWEPLRHLTLVRDMIDDFEKSLKSRKQRKEKHKHVLHSTTSQATKRRNCGSMRRLTRGYRVCTVADSQRITNIPTVERVEAHVSDAANLQWKTKIPTAAVEQEVAVVSGNAGNHEHNNQVREVIDNHHIVRIIKPEGYRPSQRDTDDPTLRFLALRADGALVLVDNHFLKENNPHLLFDYYEENINWQSRLSRHRR